VIGFPFRFLLPPRLDEDAMSQPQPKRQPLGKPIVWDDATLDALSVITPEDVEAGRQWWNRNAPAERGALLDATPEEEGEEE
jgi:hypothetical protein